MTSVLVDLNVVLDVFLNREPWVIDSAEVFRRGQAGQVDLFLSVASLPTLFYITRRHADAGRARTVIDECLARFEILGLDRKAAELAQAMSATDFEDNLQAASASLAGLDAIVTRDATGFRDGPVPALTPAELLQHLADETES